MASRFTDFERSIPRKMRFTGTSNFFPFSVCGISGTWNITSGTYRGDNSILIRSRIRLARKSSSPTVSAQHDKQEQSPRCFFPGGTQPCRVDHQRSEDFREGLHHLVKLAGAHSHPAAIERGIGTTVNHALAAIRDRFQSNLHVARCPENAGNKPDGAGNRPDRSKNRPAYTALAQSAPVRRPDSTPHHHSRPRLRSVRPNLGTAVFPHRQASQGCERTKAVQTSVPPLTEPSQTLGLDLIVHPLETIVR